MQSTARRDPDDARQGTQLLPAALDRRSLEWRRLRDRNRLLGLLLASVAALGFAIVILLAVMLRYGQTHHLLARF